MKPLRFFKKPVLAALFIMGLLFISSCAKKYNELGYNSLYYFFNGTEMDHVKCPSPQFMETSPLPSFEYSGNSLQFDLCIESPESINYNKHFYLRFQINNYGGPGKYYFDSASGNKCFFVYEQDTVYDNKKSYLRVLELDTVRRIISGTFETYFPPHQDTLPQISITQGRFYLHISHYH